MLKKMLLVVVVAFSLSGCEWLLHETGDREHKRLVREKQRLREGKNLHHYATVEELNAAIEEHRARHEANPNEKCILTPY